MYGIWSDNHVLYKAFSEPWVLFCCYFRNRYTWMGDNVIWWGLLWRIRKHRNEDLMQIPHPSVFPPFFKHSSILNKHGRISAENYCGKQISSFFKPALANISLVAQAPLYEHTLCLYFHCVVSCACRCPVLKVCLHLCVGSSPWAPERQWERTWPSAGTLHCLAQGLAPSRCHHEVAVIMAILQLRKWGLF